jgi:uncharacterized DUF497 family protein
MILPVEIEFDPAKDAENTRRHGISLAFGAVVLAAPGSRARLQL